MEELESLKKFVTDGGSLAIFVSRETKEEIILNLNLFLSAYGMRLETEEVIRTTYYKYLHPKHVYISHGILHPALISEGTDLILKDKDEDSMLHEIDSLSYTSTSNGSDENNAHFNHGQSHDEVLHRESHLAFVYPNGITIDIQPPAAAILSSGPISFPGNRPIAGTWEEESIPSPRNTMYHETKSNSKQSQQHSIKPKKGRILVMGSSDIFADEWLEKEENVLLYERLFQYLLHENGIKFDRNRAQIELLEEQKCVPNIASMAEKVQSCLQEEEPLPQDINVLFCDDLFQYNHHDLIPETMAMYKKLNVKKEALSLIVPELECPLPKCQPAIFGPRLRDLPPPSLDQFDLDAYFADESIRLAQLANKCMVDNDVEFYIREAGEILGFDMKTENNQDNQLSGTDESLKDNPFEKEENYGHHILSWIFRKVCVSYLKKQTSVDFVYNWTNVLLSFT